MSVAEQARALLSALNDAAPHIEILDNARAERDEAQRELETVKREVADHQAALERLRVDHIKTQEAHAARLKEIEAERNEAIAEMNRAKAEAQADLERVTVSVGEVQARHNALLAGLAVIGQRLAGAERLQPAGR